MDSTSVPLAGKLTTVLENQTAQWVILLIASFTVLFANAHQARLSGGDAQLYAEQARLIADSGEYATLRFGQELNHHGPLLFWLTAIAIKLLGPTPFAATLFSRLFGIGCIILTGLLGSRLFGKNTGWFAALALATCYTFVRSATTLRMDSALTFGILLAMLGHFRGEKSWGPSLFYGGVAVAVLAKSLPGLLPLFLAPLHALLAGNFHLPWKKPARRWLYWSPLVLLPLLWWGYLAAQYGGGVFAAYLDDLLSIDPGQPVDMSGRAYRFFEIYFYDFGRKYLPWIFFTVIGLKTLFSTALNSNMERPKRADAGLLLGWIFAVLIAGGLKPSQYIHYLMPALPAIAIVTAVVVVQRLKDQIPTWAPGTVAILTLISGGGHHKRTIAVIAHYFGSRGFNGISLSIRASPLVKPFFTP
jgi:4-amino-4-deoxy-L-arabinose transferase-like glycosyltransferase